MARLDRPTEKSSNPATRFLEWKSEDKCFSYYDKEKKENVKVELPLKFLFLEHYHTVKGWHDPSHSGIFSNEVFLIGTEPMTVKSFKGGEIASGLYKDIKVQVNNAGGNYHRSVYAMTEEGEIINISFKGAVVGGLKKEKAVDGKEHEGYSDFYKSNQHKLDFHWIEITGAHEGKSGRVKYSIPAFTVGERISDEIDSLAGKAAQELQAYVTNRSEVAAQEEDPRANSEVNKYEAVHAETTTATADLDNLDF